MTADTGDFRRIVTVCGQPLRVDVRAGTGTPLVMCNGIGASLEVLDPLVDHLSPDRTVIRFDAPGSGGSPTGALPQGFPRLACTLGRLLDTLEHDRVDVFGYSWGGGLAQQFALQNPRRCRRVVLAATGTGVLMVPARLEVLAKMMTPRRFTDPDHLAMVADTIYGGTARHGGADLVETLGYQRTGGSMRGYLHQLAAGAVWTSLFTLPLIRQPTLLIAGTDDPIIPVVNARIMRRLLPNSTLELHAGGHVDLLTRADVFGPLIERFLDSQRPGRGYSGRATSER
ncbi:poly(3-hydroxyalkanoate) depolymerase [Rhodococcus sp. OK611]|jgi:poly(3-hydroxyalkanoate) depolymerase|uniref:alpha/beta fold hydrolase n=1 Tax=unclassified Rhodococcus (in: high G+C Gram-positive bacteria) TaxID=192944 RepID=UPI000BC70306|nr:MULTISPECIES: alpha/beta fold hydrolase [unclassified Rhodococcus (in: high G+C Gram-positive bacteria)]PTR38964.1 poly(3-hydroxyalkanoate) depolymerase [Rhodococcus sp. OK611]SNX92750.1 poly(3-hydroxyalkanoate) depolymerase [Rhodococcus sp. OK270]